MSIPNREINDGFEGASAKTFIYMAHAYCPLTAGFERLACAREKKISEDGVCRLIWSNN